jgi:carboxylesterase type B
MYRSPVERVLAARRGLATFVYVFDPADVDGVDPGHSGELPLVFGTAPHPSAEGVILSQRMMNAWGAFARDGRPSSEPEWEVAQHGVFHWGRDPGMLRASDPELRAQLTASGASCDRI